MHGTFTGKQGVSPVSATRPVILASLLLTALAGCDRLPSETDGGGLGVGINGTTAAATISTASMLGLDIVAQPSTVTAGGSTSLSTTVQQRSAKTDSRSRVRSAATTTTWNTISADTLVQVIPRAGTVNGMTFTPPATAGTYWVVARIASENLIDSVAVSVAPTLASLSISPKTVSLATGGTQQFAASGTMSNATPATLSGVTYSATAGSVSTGGLYTAPTTAGTYRVIVATIGSALRDTSVVTVVSGGTAPLVTFLSRDAGSTAGGTTVAIFGTNLASATQVTFGGTPATISSATATTLVVLTPSRSSSGTVDVNVLTPSGNATIPAAFVFLKAPTVVFASTGFENGSILPFQNDFNRGSAAVTSETAATGTKSLRLDIDGTSGGIRRIVFSYGKNPAVTESEGVYQRYRIMLPQQTIVNAYAGQIKVSLSRATGNPKGMFMTGVGQQFAGQKIGELGQWIDYGVQQIQPQKYGQLIGGEWAEVQVWYKRSAGTTLFKTWFNGKLVLEGSNPDLGGDLGSENFAWFLGIAYTQGAAGPLVLYLDDVATANGYIG